MQTVRACKRTLRKAGPEAVRCCTHAQAHAHTTTSTLEARCQQQFAESDHSWQLNYFHTTDPTRPVLLQKHFTLNSNIFNRVTRSRAVSLQTLEHVQCTYYQWITCTHCYYSAESSRDVESAGGRGQCINLFATIKSRTQNMICENLNSCCFQWRVAILCDHQFGRNKFYLCDIWRPYSKNCPSNLTYL